MRQDVPGLETTYAMLSPVFTYLLPENHVPYLLYTFAISDITGIYHTFPIYSTLSGLGSDFTEQLLVLLHPLHSHAALVRTPALPDTP